MAHGARIANNRAVAFETGRRFGWAGNVSAGESAQFSAHRVTKRNLAIITIVIRRTVRHLPMLTFSSRQRFADVLPHRHHSADYPGSSRAPNMAMISARDLTTITAIVTVQRAKEKKTCRTPSLLTKVVGRRRWDSVHGVAPSASTPEVIRMALQLWTPHHDGNAVPSGQNKELTVVAYFKI